mmetsp:Transcript_48271/g.58233  ORF Transcript_48271/g.58233 Transcript_48271/m.58233 type:complete len:207 (-) Transcript_48271:1327-1947(-)
MFGIDIGCPDLDSGSSRRTSTLYHHTTIIVLNLFLSLLLLLSHNPTGTVHIGIKHLRTVIQHGERRTVPPRGVQYHEMHTGIGTLKRISNTLEKFHPFQNGIGTLAHNLTLLVSVPKQNTGLADLIQYILPSTQFRYQNPLLIPHRRRIDVLIRIGGPFHRRHVQTTLVREGTRSHEWRRSDRTPVHRLVHKPAERGEAGERVPTG